MPRRDIVIIPSYFRPEYLHLCLEHLLAADGGADKEIRIYQDRHKRDNSGHFKTLPEIAQVVKNFQPHFAALTYTERMPHEYNGNPYNFLEAYKSAYWDNAPLVYLVEEDVFVAKDFFRWHEALQNRANYFVTMGWWQLRNEESQKSPTGDHTAIVESAADFSSIGVCWKHEALYNVAKHANSSYYGTMVQYLRAHFPDCPIPADRWTEQAGLIMRLVLQGKGANVVAAPVVSRVAHVGIRGYHRMGGYDFPGTLNDRIMLLREAAKDTTKLRALSKDNFDDVNALPVYPLDWKPEELHVVQHFTESKANR